MQKVWKSCSGICAVCQSYCNKIQYDEPFRGWSPFFAGLLTTGWFRVDGRNLLPSDPPRCYFELDLKFRTRVLRYFKRLYEWDLPILSFSPPRIRGPRRRRRAHLGTRQCCFHHFEAICTGFWESSPWGSPETSRERIKFGIFFQRFCFSL